MRNIGIGITTYNRPDYFKDCIESVTKHLLPLVDHVVVYNDGSRVDYKEVYKDVDKRIHIEHKNKNRGVAHAKNWLMRKLLREGCDYIFLLEDDLIIKDPKAVFGYIKVADKTGISHLMFAHHGPMNKGKRIHSDPNGIELFPHCVGAWCFYTREALEAVGFMDESFKNAWEHVEHTYRLSLAGYTEEFPYFADVKGSDKWIAEQPGAIEKSSIRKDPAWAIQTYLGLRYWKMKDPLHFPFDEALRRMERNIR